MAKSYTDAGALQKEIMFDDRLKSFRKNILMAAGSPMCVQYYQDKTEWQSRGSSHVHGCCWASFERLEELFPGVKKTYEKLKQKKHLFQEDIQPLINLIKKTVTCTLSVEKLIEDFGLDIDTAMKIVN